MFQKETFSSIRFLEWKSAHLNRLGKYLYFAVATEMELKYEIQISNYFSFIENTRKLFPYTKLVILLKIIKILRKNIIFN